MDFGSHNRNDFSTEELYNYGRVAIGPKDTVGLPEKVNGYPGLDE